MTSGVQTKDTACSLTARGVRLQKNGTTILDGFSADCPSGALCAVVGPNGAGKSTFLRLLAGLEAPSSGDVHCGGNTLAELSTEDRAKLISWVPDSSPAPFHFTVLETVVMGRYPHHKGNPSPTDREIAHETLKDMGMDSFADRTLPSLSAGERQKVMMARALSAQTPVLLLDEPTASLDIASSLRLAYHLRELAAAGKTVIMSVHDLGLAHRFADHVIAIRNGACFRQGPVIEAMDADTLGELFHVTSEVATTAKGARTLVFDLDDLER